MSKELLFSVGKKDCRFDYYKGSGSGGQKRNKTSNCCRCTHLASGAVGKSEEGRSKFLNIQRAFKRMSESDKFQVWIRREVSRVTGEEAKLKEAVDKSMENIKVEIKEEGKWVKDE